MILTFPKSCRTKAEKLSSRHLFAGTSLKLVSLVHKIFSAFLNNLAFNWVLALVHILHHKLVVHEFVIKKIDENYISFVILDLEFSKQCNIRQN